MRGTDPFAAAVLLAVLLACGAGKKTEDPPAAEVAEQKEPQPAAPAEPPARKVTKEEFGESWPFTVDQAEIGCRGLGLATSGGTPLAAAYVKAAGKTYALNGVAKGQADRFGWEPEVKPIWRGNDPAEGTRPYLGSMIDLALKGCEKK